MESDLKMERRRLAVSRELHGLFTAVGKSPLAALRFHPALCRQRRGQLISISGETG